MPSSLTLTNVTQVDNIITMAINTGNKNPNDIVREQDSLTTAPAEASLTNEARINEAVIDEALIDEALIDEVMINETLNNATLNSTTWIDIERIYALLEVGGPVITILLIMSVISTSVFLLKFVQLFYLQTSHYKKIDEGMRYWQKNEPTKALTLLKRTRNPIARVLEIAILLKSRATIDDALIREEVMRIAKRQLALLKSHLRILEVIASLSPLLGLLGTVLGMITAFQQLQGAGTQVDPSILSGGIWEALLTTAAGLMVAIPTVIALNYLEHKIERFKLALEDLMTQAFTTNMSLISTSATDTSTTPIKPSATLSSPIPVNSITATGDVNKSVRPA